MTCCQEIVCPECGSNHITQSGRTEKGAQRYRCQTKGCSAKTFHLDYRYKANMPGVKRQAVKMAINGSGIQDTSRVLGINKNTVINRLKKNEKT
jgi:transposase-like protein